MKSQQKLAAVPDPDPDTVTSEEAPLVPIGVETGTDPDGRPMVGIPDSPKQNVLKAIGGSGNHYFNSHMLRSVLGCSHPLAIDGDDKVAERTVAVAAGALRAFKPTDEIEGMIAAQATALHFAAMECMRRAMLAEQPFEVASKLRRDGANLSRSMIDMLEALDRKRGKGPQVVRVERVVIHEGGQAIVGNVGGGGT